MKNRPIPLTTNFFMANKTVKIHPTQAWRFRSAIRAICFSNFEITRVHSIPQDFLSTSLTDLEKTGHSINHCMALLQKLFQVTVLISLIATSIILAYYCKNNYSHFCLFACLFTKKRTIKIFSEEFFCSLPSLSKVGLCLRGRNLDVSQMIFNMPWSLSVIDRYEET